MKANEEPTSSLTIPAKRKNNQLVDQNKRSTNNFHVCMSKNKEKGLLSGGSIIQIEALNDSSTTAGLLCLESVTCVVLGGRVVSSPLLNVVEKFDRNPAIV